jgi:hypothetical protein
MEHHAPGAIDRARHLRRTMTLAEKKLWAELRKRGLNLRRQAPVGRYIADFVGHAASLVIEIDGPLHELPDENLRDAERTLWLNSQGYESSDSRTWPSSTTRSALPTRSRRPSQEKPSPSMPLDGGGLGGGVSAEAAKRPG